VPLSRSSAATQVATTAVNTIAFTIFGFALTAKRTPSCEPITVPMARRIAGTHAT
jgi:hypothetical protein